MEPVLTKTKIDPILWWLTIKKYDERLLDFFICRITKQVCVCFGVSNHAHARVCVSVISKRDFGQILYRNCFVLYRMSAPRGLPWLFDGTASIKLSHFFICNSIINVNCLLHLIRSKYSIITLNILILIIYCCVSICVFVHYNPKYNVIIL